MIKISHEVPLCLLEKSLEFNDYDYCLPHLMDSHEEYKKFFLKAKEDGREIYLDNSLHELGTPYSEDRLHYWLQALQPNEFFVPDFWEDKTQSIVSAKKWIQLQHGYKDTTFTAVVQAKSYAEALECYQIYKDLGYKKISFSYGASYYGEECPKFKNTDLGKALGRSIVIERLFKDGIIQQSDKVHLLGTACPMEFCLYEDLPFIESLDTSNPVMLGIEGIKYPSNLIVEKPLANLNSCFDKALTKEQEYFILYNVKKFREFLGLQEKI